MLPILPMDTWRSSVSYSKSLPSHVLSSSKAIHRPGGMIRARPRILSHKRHAMNHRHLILCLLATLTSTDASAWSRMAEAEISSFKGMPCFTISKKEERRNGTPMLGALMVYDISIKPPVEVWSFILPGATTLPMHAKTCYLYGQVPAGAESTAATMLQTGRIYSVFLNGRPDDPSDSTRGYRGKFCITTDATSQQKIIAINKDMQEWRTEICPPRPSRP